MPKEDSVGARPPTFSQSGGYADYPPAIQHQSLDTRTRTDIWNLFEPLFIVTPSSRHPLVRRESVWTDYLGKIGSGFGENPYREALFSIVFDSEWHEVYSLIQALVQMSAQLGYGPPLADKINHVLALNRAGCRVVDTVVTEITDEAEIQAIGEAVAESSPEARTHLKNALALLANRDEAQYAKSISESISAAEAAARELAGDPKATLTDALKSVRRSGSSPGMHGSLIDGWIKLYSFAGDDGGIRHALREGTVPPSQALAQYFVVTCSAFVNLVTAMKADGTSP